MSGPAIVLTGVSTTDTTAEGRFRVGGRRSTVTFSGVAPDEVSAPEAFATIGRVMGWENDQSVWSVPRISPAYRAGIDNLQAVHLARFPHHHPSPLHARHRRDRPSGHGDDRRVAAFFSGGVDSFDLVAEHGDDIDDLLFVRGFDIVVHDRERNAEVLAVVQDAADAVGKPLVVVDTDLRDFSDPTCDWTWYVYAGLVSTALLLERTHRLTLCAASMADRFLPEAMTSIRGRPIGNERTALRIEGRQATRVEKLARVAASGLARDTLRVCWQNLPGTLNCGTCAKCTRTMAGLAAIGALGEIATLPDEIDLDAVAAHPAVTQSDRYYLTETLEAAEANGVTDLAAALRGALDAGEPR